VVSAVAPTPIVALNRAIAIGEVRQAPRARRPQRLGRLRPHASCGRADRDVRPAGRQFPRPGGMGFDPRSCVVGTDRGRRGATVPRL